MPSPSVGQRLRWLTRAVPFAFLLSLVLWGLAWPDTARAGAQASAARGGTIDERAFGFTLRVPDDWSIDIDAEDGPMMSWRMHHNAWLAGEIPNGLVSLNVTVLEPEVGQDTKKEFRSFVDKYARRFLVGGKVTSFDAFMFGTHAGFVATVKGRVKRQSGDRIPVSARLFIYLTDDREVIVSAVATKGAEALLKRLGEPDSLIAAGDPEPPDTGIPGKEEDPGSAQTGDAGAAASGEAPEPFDTTIIALPDSSQRFRPVSWGGGSLEEFGSLDKGGLRIVLPLGARTGGVGVASNGSLIALGDLEAGAATTVRVTFDPAHTDSAVLVLCAGRMVPCVSEPSLEILIQTDGAGTELSLWTESQLIAKEQLPNGVPERLAVRVDRDGVYVIPSGGDAMLVERPRGLAPFAALELVAAAVPTAAGGRLWLRSLSVETHQQQAPPASLPAPGEVAAVFPGADMGSWREMASSGGDFASFATRDADGLSVVVPAGHQWGVTGLVSDKPLFIAPESDGTSSPGRLHGVVDPAGSEAFAVALMPDAAGDVWFSSGAYAAIDHRADGKFNVRLFACASSERIAEMVVDEGWSGAFDLLVSPERVELALDDRRIGTRLSCLAPGTQSHVAVVAAARDENEPASLRLKSLAVDRLPDPSQIGTPDGSEADDNDFDPASWIAATAADLAEADQP